MQDGAAHSTAIVPMRVPKQWIAARESVGWDMTKGDLFPCISMGREPWLQEQLRHRSSRVLNSSR